MITPVDKIFKPDTEEYAELVELMTTIPLVGYMTNPERRRVKDMPKDKDGKVIVDFSKPHILENMSYFTKVREVFLSTGKYCEYYPSKSPNSPYKQFWDEEIKKCLEGVVREDGEWIPGYYYYYLNYSQIEIVKRKSENSKRSYKVKSFPDIWDGDYLFFHYVEKAEEAGLHGAIVKARRRGYSYKLASMLQRNYFLIRGSKSYAFASSSEYLTVDGILNKADMNFSFVNQHCGFSKKLALKDTILHRVSGYKKPGDTTEYGFKSERIGVTLKDDPDKARGKSGKLVAWEESGSNPNLLTSWNIALESVKQGSDVFGFQVAFGTGGDDANQFYGLEQLFYSPDVYEIYYINNVFDKNSSNNKCGFFIPDYLNRANCYDKDGNSDVTKAMGEVIELRMKIRNGSSDTQYLTKRKAELPFTPQEAFSRTSGSEFPINELKEHFADISPSREQFLSQHFVVELYWTGIDSVEFKPLFDKKPIREWPYKGTNLEGAIEIFGSDKLPQKTKVSKEVPRGRYIGGVDPVDDDTYKTYNVSLFCVWIFDLWEDTFVAKWMGRFPRADDNFEIALKLATFYNAELNYENKLKGLYDYFNRKHKLKYIAETPEVLKEMNYIKDARLFGNRAYGTPPSLVINAWGRKLQADWMRTVNINVGERVLDENTGLEKIKGTLGVKTLRDFEYIKECISWNIDGNFDSVSAANMVFILRADRLKSLETFKKTIEEEEDPFADDEFIRNNYKPPVYGAFVGSQLKDIFDIN
jgi:hypothetical protein